jgi:hypothetical protein
VNIGSNNKIDLGSNGSFNFPDKDKNMVVMDMDMDNAISADRAMETGRDMDKDMGNLKNTVRTTYSVKKRLYS